MLSSNNILSPAHGAPLATPTQDMVLGAYYLTYGPDADELSDQQAALTSGDWPKARPRPKVFRTAQEAELAYDLGVVKLHDLAEYRRERSEDDAATCSPRSAGSSTTTRSSGRCEVALGRTLRPRATYDFVNQSMRKRDTVKVIDALVQTYGAGGGRPGARRVQGPRVPATRPRPASRSPRTTS